MQIKPITLNNNFLAPKNLSFSGFWTVNFIDPKTKTQPSSSQDTFEKSIELQRGQIIKDGKIYTRKSTHIFRSDIYWDIFGQYIKERFNNVPKVNTYNYACSMGLEPYSLAMLIKSSQVKPSRFFPIHAKDIDKKIIEESIQKKEENAYVFSGRDFCTALQALGLSDEDMLSGYMMIKEGLYCSAFKLDPKIVNKVDFEHGNILEDIENIDSKKPSLVLCRNMWPYVDKSEYEEFAKNLYDKLAPGSSVVIGYFDIQDEWDSVHDYSIAQELIKAGFTPAKPEVVNKIDYHHVEYLIFEKN